METQKFQDRNKFMSNKRMTRGIINANLKFYYRAIVIKTAWY